MRWSPHALRGWPFDFSGGVRRAKTFEDFLSCLRNCFIDVGFLTQHVGSPNGLCAYAYCLEPLAEVERALLVVEVLHLPHPQLGGLGLGNGSEHSTHMSRCQMTMSGQARTAHCCVGGGCWQVGYKQAKNQVSNARCRVATAHEGTAQTQTPLGTAQPDVPLGYVPWLYSSSCRVREQSVGHY